VDEEKSTKPHEITRKEFSANSCDLVDENLVDEKRILVDLTGGMGVDTAFLSDNFDKAYYVEMQEELCEIAKHNFKILNKNIEVVNDNAEHFLTICDKVDCIYLDPARRDEYGRKMVSLHDCSPDVAELQDILLEKAKTVIVKLSPMLDIDIVKKELKNIKEIHVVAVRNECKEILIEIQNLRNSESQKLELQCHNDAKIDSATSIKISATDLRENWNFDFSEDEELEAQWTLADNVGKYLYEPGVACMKAGCFKLLSQKYNLDKLHRNSHLYTSDELASDFPGRIFEVVNTVPFDKKTKKEISSICQQTTDSRQQTDSKLAAKSSKLKASVTVRNFPLSAEELKKNLGLQDGNDFYIFGTTMKGEKKVVVLTKKL
jgi:16S rRNA G966 N2-methylase RsmD